MDKTLGPMVFIPDKELDEVRAATPGAQRHLFVAGFVDFMTQEVILFRVDETEVIAPFALFKERAGVAPDFDKLEIIDYGNTVKLGEYQASSAAILYDLDSEYREYCDTNRMIN